MCFLLQDNIYIYIYYITSHLYERLLKHFKFQECKAFKTFQIKMKTLTSKCLCFKSSYWYTTPLEHSLNRNFTLLVVVNYGRHCEITHPKASSYWSHKDPKIFELFCAHSCLNRNIWIILCSFWFEQTRILELLIPVWTFCIAHVRGK